MFDNMTKKIIAGLSVFIIVFTIVCVPIVTKADDELSLGVYHYSDFLNQNGYVFNNYTSLTSDLINNIDAMCDNLSISHLGMDASSSLINLGLGDYIDDWDYLNPSFYVTCYHDTYGLYFIFTGNSSVATPSTTNVTNQFRVRSTPVVLFDGTYSDFFSGSELYRAPKVFLPTIDSDRYSIGYYNLTNYNAPSGIVSYWGYSADLIKDQSIYNYSNSTVNDDVFFRRFSLPDSDALQCSSLLESVINGSKKYFSVYLPISTQTGLLSSWAYVSNKIIAFVGPSQMHSYDYYMFSYANVFDDSDIQIYTHTESIVYNYMTYGFTSSSVNDIFSLVLGRFIYRGGGGSPIVTPTPFPSIGVLTPTPFPDVTLLPVPTGIELSYDPTLDLGSNSQPVSNQIKGIINEFNSSFRDGIFAVASTVLSYFYHFSDNREYNYAKFIFLVPAGAFMIFLIGRLNRR